MDYPQDCWGDNFKLNTNIDMSRGCPWLHDVIVVYLVLVAIVTAWFLFKTVAAALAGEWGEAWRNLRIAWYVLLIGYMGPAAIIFLVAWAAGDKKGK
jgi:hypothetical protein